jgi:hypothetical protein
MNYSHSYGIHSVLSIGSEGQEHAKAIDSKVMKSCCAASNKYINSAEMTHVYKLPTDLVVTGVARARPRSAQPFA